MQWIALMPETMVGSSSSAAGNPKKRRKAGLPPAELAVAEGPPASKGADFDGDET